MTIPTESVLYDLRVRYMTGTTARTPLARDCYRKSLDFRHFNKELCQRFALTTFLVGGALFLLIGSLAFVSGMVKCFPTPAKPALLLLAGSLPQFLAGGLGIKFRHYPNMAGLCGAAALLALAASVLWVFLNEQYALSICSGMSTLVYMMAWSMSHR